MEVGTETGQELVTHLRVGERVDLSDDFFHMPCHAHLALWVTGFEQPEELRPAVVVESFVGLGEQPPGPVKRIGFVTPMAERVVLHPAAALIELGVCQLHDMERISDLDRIGEHRGQRQAPRP